MPSPASKPMTCATCGQASVSFDSDQRNPPNPICKVCLFKSQDSLNVAFAKSCNAPINFEEVFEEMQQYKRQHGNLWMTPDDQSYGKIIDFLAASNIESVIKKRWFQKFAAVQSLELDPSAETSSNVDAELGKWIQTQLDYFELYKEGLPNPLSARQVELLEEIGLQNLLRLKSVAESHKNVSNGTAEQNEKMNDSLLIGDGIRAAATEMKIERDQTPSKAVSEYKQETPEKQNESSDHPEFDANCNVEKHITTTSQNDNKYISIDASGIQYIKGKCDVCRKKDGHQGHNLQRCKDCGLKVHELCYGLIASESKNPNFVCHACQSVGKEVEVNNPSRVGSVSKKNTRETMKQHTRPTECILCNFDDGSIHAMHPIMDTDGEDGRQLVLSKTKDKEKRLAWAHTLCAQVICKNKYTAGCVYGLSDDNTYDDGNGEQEVLDDSEEEELSDEDDASGSKAAPQDGNGAQDVETELTEEARQDVEDTIELSSVCAYAIAGKQDKQWYDRIQLNRSKFKCYICGLDDKRSLRIPLMCIVDEVRDRKIRDPAKKFEYFEFNEWRKNCLSYDPFAACTVAMHVGCARWGANLETIAGKICHQVYFYPGQQIDNDGEDVRFKEVVANCYCPSHARELIIGNPKNVDKLDEENFVSQKKKRGSKMSAAKQQPPPKKARRNCQYEAKTKKAMQPEKKSRRDRQHEAQPKEVSAPMERTDTQPFGRKESAVAFNDANQEDFVTLGRSGRAMTKKRDAAAESDIDDVSTGHPKESNASDSHSSVAITQVTGNSEQNESTEAAAATAAAPNHHHSFKNLLSKMAKPGTSYANAKVPATAHQERKRSHSVLFNTSSSFKPAILKPPATKPVGILKNKGPGPIIHAASVQKDLESEAREVTRRPPIKYKSEAEPPTNQHVQSVK